VMGLTAGMVQIAKAIELQNYPLDKAGPFL